MTFKSLVLKTCIFALLLSSSALIAAPPEHAKAYGLGEPAHISDLPPGLFRSNIEALPAEARSRALEWLQNLTFPAADVEFLRVDATGGIFYADTFLPELTAETTGSEQSGAPAAETIAPADTFFLHSKPGSSNVVYLDFDGHIIPATSAWTTIDLHALAYDNSFTDDDGAFTTSELNDIAEIWHRVAEDYAPFDVDVTTEEPDIFTSTTGRLLFTSGDKDANGIKMPASGAGGVAYVNVFGSSSYVNVYSPALVYYYPATASSSGYFFPPFLAEAASHEFGHNQGMGHDTQNGNSYYGGHGSGLVSWGPIMGTGYNRNVSQWSKGEYSGADNTQDDLAIMDNKMGYRVDDHGDSITTATALLVDAAGNIPSTNPETDPFNFYPDNKGIIELRSDVDMFYFDAAAGTVSLSILPAWDAFERPSNDRGANLDVQATLYDDSGAVITSSDPTEDTRADISTTVSAGRYYLGITGVGNSISPYTDYGSLGYYYIFGSVVPQNLDTTAPTPSTMIWASVPTAQGKYAITMTAVTASDDSGFVEYNFLCVSGGQGCVNSGWQTSTSFTANGLAAGSSYGFQVKARDGSHNENTASATASAITDAETVPANPSNFTATVNSTSQINLSWSDTVDNEDYFVIERSLDGSTGWSSIANLVANSTSYSDNGLAHSTTYFYRLKATNVAGDSPYVSTSATTDSPPASIDYTAINETLSSGTVSGTYQATTADDDSIQSITERDSGGRPQNRYDYLTHTWTFNISGGDVVNLLANAWVTGGSEDAFIFEVSVNGGSYQPAFTVSSNNVNNVESAILSGATGVINVRVRDNDQTAGNNNHQAINIDHLYIHVDNAVGGGEVPNDPTGLTASADSSSQITIAWTDNANNESGFTIERSLDNSNWSVISTVGVDAFSYTDIGLDSNTLYYYKVKAFNATGDSGYTNTASASTSVAPSITLSATGFKDKGKHNVDLVWEGAGSNVDIFRDGNPVVTNTTNDGSYTDNIGTKGGATYVYKVCETGTQDCSDEVTVIF